jgi:hypothetical protein
MSGLRKMTASFCICLQYTNHHAICDTSTLYVAVRRRVKQEPKSVTEALDTIFYSLNFI